MLVSRYENAPMTSSSGTLSKGIVKISCQSKPVKVSLWQKNVLGESYEHGQRKED